MNTRRIVILAVIGLIGLTTVAGAQTTFSTYDTKSNRTGYGRIDPKTERFDLYDTKSNRTGYGVITRTAPPRRAENKASSSSSQGGRVTGKTVK